MQKEVKTNADFSLLILVVVVERIHPIFAGETEAAETPSKCRSWRPRATRRRVISAKPVAYGSGSESIS